MRLVPIKVLHQGIVYVNPEQVVSLLVNPITHDIFLHMSAGQTFNVEHTLDELRALLVGTNAEAAKALFGKSK